MKQIKMAKTNQSLFVVFFVDNIMAKLTNQVRQVKVISGTDKGQCKQPFVMSNKTRVVFPKKDLLCWPESTFLTNFLSTSIAEITFIF